jgi:S-adenosylmethionine/arginine decarboxylase-like enzyme
MDSIRRVIFLGSGDAMLLHEILKYPHLEKVVGLELDQQVTRKSFKNFKTQPHFDDERVEWWYGDATKTLPLLPREYWGTFDLVLVDLSETVVSMSVTGKHDIFEVISMLLKPEGILLENELYKEKMSGHFDHTIQIFYGSPKVCTQVLTMSSNKVDFLRHPINDHGVQAYLVEPVKDSHDRFKYIHDYIKTTPRGQGKCQDPGSAVNATTVVQGRIAGVLQIVEAENASVQLNEEIEEVIYSVVRKEGFTPISSPSNDDGVVVVAMKEGYVVARMWPEHNYCAFDINLWGGFHKANQLRSALVEAVGSTSISSYRIVVGGMHGSNTRKEDQEVIGIQFAQKRNCEIDDRSDKAVVNQETLNVAVAEALALVDSTQLVVAVACGIKNKDRCPMVDVLSQHPSVQKVIPLWTCSGLAESSDELPDFPKLHDCEKGHVSQIEEEVVSKDLKLDMFFFDSSATYAMFQIIHSIFSVLAHREWLGDNYVLATPFFGKDSIFKRRFVDRYRKQHHPDIVSAAKLVFKGSKKEDMGIFKGSKKGYMAIELLLAGDDYAIDRFYDLESKLRQRLPNTNVEILVITGGKDHPKHDLEYEGLAFTPDKYDFRPSQEQFSQQKPLGRQSVYQLDLAGDATMLTFGELSQLLQQTLQKMEYSPSRFDKFTDVGDGGMLVSIFSQGSVILVWDGSHHVDINLFSFDQSQELADSFVSTFTELSGNSLQVSLRDDQPRGIGRVVSFSSEIDSDNYITYATTE